MSFGMPWCDAPQPAYTLWLPLGPHSACAAACIGPLSDSSEQTTLDRIARVRLHMRSRFDCVHKSVASKGYSLFEWSVGPYPLLRPLWAYGICALRNACGGLFSVRPCQLLHASCAHANYTVSKCSICTIWGSKRRIWSLETAWIPQIHII